jgi:phosphomannomutase
MYLTPELRLPAERLSFETVLSRLKGSLGIESASMLDGIRIATADGFVLARPSVTEPITTFRIEGLHELGLRRLVGRCLEMFPEFSSDIREQIHREDCL